MTTPAIRLVCRPYGTAHSDVTITHGLLVIQRARLNTLIEARPLVSLAAATAGLRFYGMEFWDLSCRYGIFRGADPIDGGHSWYPIDGRASHRFTDSNEVDVEMVRLLPEGVLWTAGICSDSAIIETPTLSWETIGLLTAGRNPFARPAETSSC